MNKAPLPPNVYRLPQRRFDAIPGAPWVYWVSESILALFGDEVPKLADSLDMDMGLKTSGNDRFVRWWWEVSSRVWWSALNRQDAVSSKARWFPYAKGAASWKWSGAAWSCVVWQSDGHEIKEHLFHQYPYLNGDPGWCTHNEDLYFSPVVVWGTISSSGLSASFLRSGSIISNANYGIFAHEPVALHVLGFLNSRLSQYLLGLVSPTINFNLGEVEKLPIMGLDATPLGDLALSCVLMTDARFTAEEASPHFRLPLRWLDGLEQVRSQQYRLSSIERQIDDEVYRLYGISDADRAAIEAELAGGALDHEDGEGDEDTKPEEREEEAAAGVMTQEELAVRWISYAVGVVLGRFEVGGQRSNAGGQKPIGRAVYHHDDFAIGSLPAPDEAEFDELVGPVERFAYVDAAGGRHVFAAEVEQALRDLALPDGIAVLDEGHPRDLPALVEKALRLMLDGVKREDVMREDAGQVLRFTQHAASQADEVIALGANGDLRKFLEKDFFTKWHLKWYRKRPVYWPLQSARRGYSFVLFHEKVEKYTLYVLLRDYLDHKLNGLRLQIEDLAALAAGQTGVGRRQTERQLDRSRQLLDEVNVFAQAIDRIAKGGYQPEANWIDDGVILRLAPLWELIPIWKAEPKKYWERLEQGDYDWSHIAMAYWPARVRAVCRVNKSFAIAHGHEEWYTGA